MSENKQPDPGTEALAVPGVDVKIYLPKDPEKDHGKLLGFASVNLGGVFAVNGIRIYETEKGPYVAMPSTKGQDGKYHDMCCPATKEMRQAPTPPSWAHTKKRWSRSVLPCAAR